MEGIPTLMGKLNQRASNAQFQELISKEVEAMLYIENKIINIVQPPFGQLTCSSFLSQTRSWGDWQPCHAERGD